MKFNKFRPLALKTRIARIARLSHKVGFHVDGHIKIIYYCTLAGTTRLWQSITNTVIHRRATRPSLFLRGSVHATLGWGDVVCTVLSVVGNTIPYKESVNMHDRCSTLQYIHYSLKRWLPSPQHVIEFKYLQSLGSIDLE